MKKKALIIISIIVVAFIIILLPNNNNNIEKTTAETNLAEPTPEATPTPEPTATPKPTATPAPEPTIKPEPTPTPESETTAEEENTEDSSVNSTHTDVILGDDEYKGDNEANLKESATSTVTEADLDAIADQIYQDLLKEHPEWVADENITQQGNYESVGTPDNGILPESTFGQGDYSGLEGGQVY